MFYTNKTFAIMSYQALDNTRLVWERLGLVWEQLRLNKEDTSDYIKIISYTAS